MAERLTTTQVARLLGVNDARVRQLCAEGRLEAEITPLGRLFTRAAVEAFRATRRAG